MPVRNSKSESNSEGNFNDRFAGFHFQVFWWQNLQIFQISSLRYVCFPFPSIIPALYQLLRPALGLQPTIPQVQKVCRSCRSQSITEVHLRWSDLGDEEVKACRSLLCCELGVYFQFESVNIFEDQYPL